MNTPARRRCPGTHCAWCRRPWRTSHWSGCLRSPAGRCACCKCWPSCCRSRIRSCRWRSCHMGDCAGTLWPGFSLAPYCSRFRSIYTNCIYSCFAVDFREREFWRWLMLFDCNLNKWVRRILWRNCASQTSLQ